MDHGTDVVEAAEVPRLPSPQKQHEQQGEEAGRPRSLRRYSPHEDAQRDDQHREVHERSGCQSSHGRHPRESTKRRDDQGVRIGERVRRVDAQQRVTRPDGMRRELAYHGAVFPEVADPMAMPCVKPAQRKQTCRERAEGSMLGGGRAKAACLGGIWRARHAGRAGSAVRARDMGNTVVGSSVRAILLPMALVLEGH